MIFRGSFPNSCFIYFVFLATCFNHITTGIMFDIAHIGPHNHNKEILTEGAGTYISTDGIQLASHSPNSMVSDQDLVGRATYAKLFHLWDIVTGQLADFTTSFTFAIGSDGAADYGDGLSFFLARNNSLVTASGTMGLPVVVNSSNSHMMKSSSPFVAVEFDTFWNKDWDPVDSTEVPIRQHVGININSLLSSKIARWDNFTYSKECVVDIQYDSGSKNLSVTFTDFHNNTVIPNQFQLHYTVDLRRELSEWVMFGFSSSSSGSNFQKNSVKSWYFNSSDLYADQIRRRKGRKKRRIRTYVVVGSLIGIVIGFVLIGIYACVYCWNKKPDNKHLNQIVRKDPEVTIESNNHPRAFSFTEMSQATNNFHEENKLGEGGFGAVYKGVLSNGIRVAVKKVSATSKQGVKEYKAEVEIISRASHRHLVQLMGWCHELEGELLVVYELMDNRSLDGHLFNSESPLSWDIRYNIARGLAMALRYLHEECAQCILHRDIKSSNVMLDSEFNPKLGDFGLAKLVDHGKLLVTTNLAGTLGYLAPECFSNGKVSRQSDVYSFGVVALEIATGRKAIDVNAQESQRSLIDWVRGLYRMDRILEAVDTKLDNDMHDKNQMKGLITLGLWCVHPDPDERPTIGKVVCVLNNINDPLSELPQQMPSLVRNMPLPHQSLDSVLENSHSTSASSAPCSAEANGVSNPNAIVALAYRVTSTLQYVWHQLDIE